MKFDFTLRVYKDSYQPIWYDFNNITISNITLVSKRNKFELPCLHNGNQKKFSYCIDVKGKFAKVAGSNSSPILSFKGEYIDIKVKYFPRYPSLGQCIFNARNTMKSGYQAYMGDGFEKLHFDILNLTQSTIKNN